MKKDISTILSFIGAGGVICTTILGIKATPKAMILLEEKRVENNNESLVLSEKIKTVWKLYIPTFLSGLATISCIFGSNYLNKRTQASLISAYGILSNTYLDYVDKMREENYSKSIDIEKKILESKFDNNIVLDGSKDLFYDYQSMRYFQSTNKELENARHILNEQIYKEGYACLNDLYDILNLKRVPYGYQLGWCEINEKQHTSDALHFVYNEIILDDGLECFIFNVEYNPSIVYLS